LKSLSKTPQVALKAETAHPVSTSPQALLKEKKLPSESSETRIRD
jgi:hypothetical protein